MMNPFAWVPPELQYPSSALGLTPLGPLGVTLLTQDHCHPHLTSGKMEACPGLHNLPSHAST